MRAAPARGPSCCSSSDAAIRQLCLGIQLPAGCYQLLFSPQPVPSHLAATILTAPRASCTAAWLAHAAAACRCRCCCRPRRQPLGLTRWLPHVLRLHPAGHPGPAPAVCAVRRLAGCGSGSTGRGGATAAGRRVAIRKPVGLGMCKAGAVFLYSVWKKKTGSKQPGWRLPWLMQWHRSNSDCASKHTACRLVLCLEPCPALPCPALHTLTTARSAPPCPALPCPAKLFHH